MSASEMSCNNSNIATHAEKQGKRVCELERTADDIAAAITYDDEDTNILRGSDLNNKYLGRQPQISKRPSK